MTENGNNTYFTFGRSEERGCYKLGSVEASSKDEAWRIAISRYGNAVKDVVLSYYDTPRVYSLHLAEKIDGGIVLKHLGFHTAKPNCDIKQIATELFGVNPEDAHKVGFSIIQNPDEQAWLQHESD